MINNINSRYTNLTLNENSKKAQKTIETPKQELSKVEDIKKRIENGTYKVDLDTLAEIIADDLKK